ncbi:MAG: hypothetical protein V4664_03240 [Patescibacteria group bacterium]
MGRGTATIQLTKSTVMTPSLLVNSIITATTTITICILCYLIIIKWTKRRYRRIRMPKRFREIVPE